VSRITNATPRQPWQPGTPLQELRIWRREMEVHLSPGRGDLMGLMFARNRVGAWRDDLAPDEWFPCPSCGGRGLWVDQSGRNCYCARCTGTGILLACEQAELGSKHTGGKETVRERRHPWLRRRMNPWSTMISRKRP
jgi:hypothetical protein